MSKQLLSELLSRNLTMKFYIRPAIHFFSGDVGKRAEKHHTEEIRLRSGLYSFNV